MYFKKIARIFFCLDFVLTNPKTIEQKSSSIENDFREIAEFLKATEPNRTEVFSPLNAEIICRLESYISSLKNKNSEKFDFSSIYKLYENMEKDESFNISNTISMGKDILLDTKTGALNIKIENLSSNLHNICEENFQNVIGIEMSKEINPLKSTLHFEGNLKNIFDSSKTNEKTFHIDGQKINRKFMSASKIFNVYEDYVDRKKFYITILPFDDKKSRRYLVHLIPMTDGIDLNELWSKFSKITKFDFKSIFNKVYTRHVKLTIPKIINLCSQINMKWNLGSDIKNQRKLTQDNFSTINEGILVPKKTFYEILLDYWPLLKINVIADRPYLAVVYDSEMDRILLVLKDTGL